MEREKLVKSLKYEMEENGNTKKVVIKINSDFSCKRTGITRRKRLNLVNQNIMKLAMKIAKIFLCIY